MLFALFAPALAATLTVDASGGADHRTVQAAIRAARSGDTIEVAAGTYAENLDTLGKDLTLLGVDGSGRTTLDGAGGDHVVEISRGEAVTLIGFTLTGGSHGVELRASTLVAEDIVVEDVTGESPGGGFNVVDGASLTLDACEVRGVSLTDNRYGGAFFIEDATASVSDCVIDGNHARQGGGAYVTSSVVTFTDVEFIDNVADSKGGALRVRDGSDLTLVRVEVRGSVAGDKGGGLSAEDSDVTARSTTFEDNIAADAGGGVSFERALRSGLVLRGEVRGNHSGGAGGGVYVASADAELDGEIADNSLDDPSASRGGGVYFAGGDLTLVDLAVSGQRAAEGGGVYVAAGSGALDLTNTSFSSNEALGDGGALWTARALTVEDSAFSDNRAGGDGGAILADEAELTVIDTDFTRNLAAVDGGAVEVYRAEALVQRCVFVGNEAGGMGGAVHHLAVSTGGAQLTFASNTLRQNAAAGGGGLYSDASPRTVSRYNRYEDNTPDGATLAGPDALVVRGDTFIDNRGAGLVVSSAGGGSLINSRFLGNEGAGAQISGGVDLSIANDVFVGNGEAGLELRASVGSVEVVNVDALDNDVGILVQSGAGVEVVNAILAFNRVGLSASSSAPDLRYSDIHGNQTDLSGGVARGAGLLDLDPAYSAWRDDGNAANDLLSLSSTSPCRDAGDPAILDVDGSRSDMGSFGGPGAEDEDEDGDGFRPSDGDCDEADPAVHPGAEDAWYDGVDADCDGEDDFDQDGDGWRHPDAGSPEPDCDDLDPEVHPGADDAPGDGVDADCDGHDGQDRPGDDDSGGDTDGDSGGADDPWTDADGDGFTEARGDCDDADPEVHEGAEEVCDDGVDNDCDGNLDGRDASCRGSAACACAGGAGVRGGLLPLALALALVWGRQRTWSATARTVFSAM